MNQLISRADTLMQNENYLEYSNQSNFRFSKKKVLQILRLFKKDAQRDIESLSITLVHDEEMIAINETHLGHEGSTDVITFEYETDLTKPLNGELIICKDEAKRNAQELKISLEQEIIRLIFHGLLHMNGFDDVTADLKKEIRAKEDSLLKLWNNKI